MINKILGVIFTVLFVFAAVVQFNDPDSLLWILLYFVAALVSLLFSFGRLKMWIVLILVPIYLILAVMHWPPQFEGVALDDGMKTINIELARESLGMVICAIAMFLYALRLRKLKS